VDPSRLIDSASRVYGPLLDSLYGRLDATEADRVAVLGDGDRLAISSERYLEAIDSPGHAKHHLGLLDSRSGVLFAGDAAGVRLPDAGVLRPASPPPDFDLELALRSLRRFADKSPSALALAHYGIVEDPQALLAEAAEVLLQWSAIAERAWADGRDIAAALEFELSPQLEAVDPEQREKMETLNGIHSNAAGLRRWLEQRHKSDGNLHSVN
jgi:glyoxylase-like metal-dependent hydrolase (beta-lactamase superfamily II)